MPKRKIVTYGNQVLRKKSEIVEQIDDEIRKLVNDMIETMYEAPGIGLAANQVGVAKQVIVVDMRVKDPNLDAMAFINPRIIESSGEDVVEEGCLSFPQLNVDIKRPETIKVKAIDIDGREIISEENGLAARVLQHEIDHLNGVLFIDHLNFVKKKLLRKEIKRIEELSKKSKQSDN